MHRRQFAFASGWCFLATALNGCGAITSNTTGGVTTLTVNVTQLNAWGQAFASGAKLIAGLPGIAGTAAGIAILAVATAVGTDLAAFNKVAGGSVSLSFNSTSIPAAVQSLANDGQTLLADASGALVNVATTAMTNAQTYINAVQTIVSLFQAELSAAPVGAALKATSMTEATALATLGVK